MRIRRRIEERGSHHFDSYERGKREQRQPSFHLSQLSLPPPLSLPAAIMATLLLLRLQHRTFSPPPPPPSYPTASVLLGAGDLRIQSADRILFVRCTFCLGTARQGRNFFLPRIKRLFICTICSEVRRSNRNWRET